MPIPKREDEESNYFRQHFRELSQKLLIEGSSLDHFMSIWYRTDAKARTTLFEAGNTFDEIWYVVRGCVRAIRVVNGIPWTYLLHIKGHFTTEYLSYVKEIPGKMSFDTVTDAVIYRAKKQDLLSLYEEYPSTSAFGLYIARYAHAHTFNRIMDLQLKSLKERYLDLLEQTPLFFEIAPQQDIASYLGVTPESLSRLKADLMKESKIGRSK